MVNLKESNPCLDLRATVTIENDMLQKLKRLILVCLVFIVLIYSSLACRTLYIKKESVPSEIISLSLINADTGQPIKEFDPLQDGSIINLNQMPTRKFILQANTYPTEIDNVRFSFVEHNSSTLVGGPPYSYPGFYKSQGKYLGMELDVGKQTFLVTPYNNGIAGKPIQVRIEVK